MIKAKIHKDIAETQTNPIDKIVVNLNSINCSFKQYLDPVLMNKDILNDSKEHNDYELVLSFDDSRDIDNLIGILTEDKKGVYGLIGNWINTSEVLNDKSKNS